METNQLTKTQKKFLNVFTAITVLMFFTITISMIIEIKNWESITWTLSTTTIFIFLLYFVTNFKIIIFLKKSWKNVVGFLITELLLVITVIYLYQTMPLEKIESSWTLFMVVSTLMLYVLSFYFRYRLYKYLKLTK